MVEGLLLVGVVAALGCAAWLLRDLRTVPRGTGHRMGPHVRSVSVVVPARDEEATLPALLEALRRLEVGTDVGIADIVVVDDD